MRSLFRKMAGATEAPIGIDCGSRLLKAVQLRPAGSGFEVVAASAAPVAEGVWDDPAALARYFRRDVRRVLDAGGFRGRQVALALPSHRTHVASVRKDHANGAGEGAWEPSPEWLPFHESEALVRNIEAGDVYEGGVRRREVVTLAVRRNVVEGYVAAAAEAGLQPVGVTAEPEALLAALSLSGADSRLMRLVVDLGMGSTRVYAGVGRRLMFARQLKTGGRHLERAVSAALGVAADESSRLRSQLPPLDRDGTVSDARLRKVDEACQETIFRLVTEIRMCLHYVGSVFGHTPVHHVVFVGGGTKYRRLCQRLASGVGLPARAADPLGRLSKQPAAEGGPVWATAVGLAVQGAAAASSSPVADAWNHDGGAIGRVALSA